MQIGKGEEAGRRRKEGREGGGLFEDFFLKEMEEREAGGGGLGTYRYLNKCKRGAGIWVRGAVTLFVLKSPGLFFSFRFPFF